MAKPDPYGDILDQRPQLRAAFPEVEATPGLAVEHRSSRFRGVVARHERDGVVIRNPIGSERVFRLVPGAFTVDGATVSLVRPKPGPRSGRPTRTASGSVAVGRAPARVAATSRILVEGVHDAELVEKVWGDDLRVEGVVVERLDGIDVLADVVRTFAPGPGRRLGVLVDHLVAGSKEARLAAEVRHPHVLVTGTPYVDIWQAVKPTVAGIEAWPSIPKGTPWKEGICDALGVGEPRAFWPRLLGSVRTYADLEPALVGAVERLIDFVTDPVS
ncbi:MAG: hypothetical protein QOG64_491 [Acidimicrobiaceae bacterium]|nr:hypothetical protein [Acidimicrobiaceae bacterium]